MGATDEYGNLISGLNAPVEHLFAITPADGSDLSYVTRGLYVGVSGDVKMDMVGGETVTIKNLAPGHFHPLRVTRVYSTGTTAEDIVGGY